MTSVWTTADALAAELAKTKHLTTFRAGLKERPTAEDPPFAVKSVRALLVHYSMLQSQPLLLGMRLPLIPEFETLHDGSPEVQRWLEAAQRLSFGFAELVEFVRSRLPGYPSLLVPDVAPGASRVKQDGFWDARFPWIAELRRAGLQLSPRPELTLRALELPDGGEALLNALGELLAAVRATSSWQQFEAAHRAMDGRAQAAAKELRKAYRKAVSEERADAIAGDTGMRDASFRRAELEAVKARASGPVSEYFAAFDDVDELIDTLAAFVSHRVCEGPISTLSVVSADWGPPADLRAVRVRADDDEFRRTYELMRIPSAVPALAGVMLLHNLTMHFKDDDSGTLLLADGRLLSGSASVPATAPQFAYTT